MELETFLEQDMREFLDEKADEQRAGRQQPRRVEDAATYNLSRDYAEEVSEALDEGNVGKAQNVYNDLKSEYRDFPQGAAGQRQAYSVMREIHGLFKQAGHADAIQLPDPPGESSYESRRERQIHRLKRQKRKKDALVKKIKRNMKRVTKLLDEKDPLAAVYVYKEAKRMFSKIPKRFEHVREDIYDELITCYYQISKRTGSKPEEILEQDDDQSDHAPILSRMQDVRNLIQKKKLRRATEEYQAMIDDLKDYDGSQRDELLKDAHALRESLQKAQERSMRRQQRSPPEKAIDEHVDEDTVQDAIKRGKRKAYNYLRNGNTTSAMKQYHQLKQYYQQLEGNERQRFYKSLLSLHRAIMHEKKKQFQDKREASDDNAYSDAIREIESLLDEGNAMEAERHYLDLQSQLLEATGDEREDLHEAIHTIKHKLHEHNATTDARRGGQ